MLIAPLEYRSLQGETHQVNPSKHLKLSLLSSPTPLPQAHTAHAQTAQVAGTVRSPCAGHPGVTVTRSLLPAGHATG